MANNRIHKSNDKKNIDLLRVKSPSIDCIGCYYNTEKPCCEHGYGPTKCLQNINGTMNFFIFTPAFP